MTDPELARYEITKPMTTPMKRRCQLSPSPRKTGELTKDCKHDARNAKEEFSLKRNRHYSYEIVCQHLPARVANGAVWVAYQRRKWYGEARQAISSRSVEENRRQYGNGKAEGHTYDSASTKRPTDEVFLGGYGHEDALCLRSIERGQKNVVAGRRTGFRRRGGGRAARFAAHGG